MVGEELDDPTELRSLAFQGPEYCLDLLDGESLPPVSEPSRLAWSNVLKGVCVQQPLTHGHRKQNMQPSEVISCVPWL
jgi:hypothetical protein